MKKKTRKDKAIKKIKGLSNQKIKTLESKDQNLRIKRSRP